MSRHNPRWDDHTPFGTLHSQGDLPEQSLSQIPSIFVMAADAAIHGSCNLMDYLKKFNIAGWRQLILVTESTSISVDGRVRGHDEKGGVYSDSVTKLTAWTGYFFWVRTTCVNPAGPLAGKESL